MNLVRLWQASQKNLAKSCDKLSQKCGVSITSYYIYRWASGTVRLPAEVHRVMLQEMLPDILDEKLDKDEISHLVEMLMPPVRREPVPIEEPDFSFLEDIGGEGVASTGT